MRNFAVVIALVLAAVAAPASTAKPKHPKPSKLPQTIALPNGWQPEGIASHGTTLYSGSRVDGAVWAGSAKTGQGGVVVPGHTGRSATGMEIVGKRLLVSGGASGGIYVYNRRTGADVAAYDVDGGFINDVTTLAGKAYFTDSQKPVLYVLPRSGVGTPRTLPITGDLVYGPGFNANGIEAVKGALVTVQSNTGKLFRINRKTGASREIDLGGVALTAGDGLLSHGKRLYVVQNQLNQITVLKLSKKLRSGRVVETITNPNFDTPTTVTKAKGALWVVNARFTTPPTPDTTYNIVRVR
jgi:hypothetical protein